MPDTNTETSAPTREELLMQRLENIETLLEHQQKHHKKALFHRRLGSLLLLGLVVVLGVGMYNLAGTLKTATGDLPELIQHTDELVQQVNAVDFETLNSSLSSLDKGLGKLDFTALNESIQNLAEVSQALSKVAGFFGG